MLDAEARGHWVRLRTLLALRWVAVAGQTAAVLAARFGFGLDLPLAACLAVVGASAAVNLAVWNMFPANKRLSERGAMLSLLFDLGQVSLILGLTGGLTNPFAVLMLAPVTIAASVLTLRSTLILASAAMALTSVMLVFHRPLAFVDGTVLRPPDLYLLGLWIAMTLGIVFMAIYTRRIGIETSRMAEALAAAQLSLSREQRLTAIGALAAAAAHELGTPLATIKLISGELARDLKDQPEYAEDLALLRAQADRCREILRDLSEGGRDDAHVRHAPIVSVIEEAAQPHRDRGKTMVIRVNGMPAEEVGDAQPVIARRPEIIHGLRNLIQNAVDFAADTIWVEVLEREATLRIAVGDDGPGFRADVLDRIGDPYVTTRGRGRGRAEKEGGYQGMGLGLFIAKTLLERTGARLVFANGKRGGGGPTGAIVAAIWPHEAVVARRGVARAPLGENPRFTRSNI
ncbi:MAG: sensor histidine kinase [Rhodobacteraceae bacterium]|nr:MAG: sensor histidine kinase [Paracoccaceae bacterium]